MILEDSAVPCGTHLIGQGFIFEHDNDPKHTSRLCKDFLEEKEQHVMKLMIWPPQSTDLNY